MAPELYTTMEADELISLGTRIRDWQDARKETNNGMLRRFAGLGSTKTFDRIVRGELGELDLERQLNNYRAVWSLIETIGAGEGVEEELYDDLNPAIQLRRAFSDILAERTDARLIVLEGDSGTGKTKASKLLVGKYGQRILWIEAMDLWGDSPMAMMGAILEASGKRELPAITAIRLNMVLTRLREHRTCLVIDEAHHLGPHCLNTVKGLINQTPGEFVLLAMPTLWRRLERTAYEEVRQLAGNRLAERIKLEGIREADVRKMLERRTEGLDFDPRHAAKMILDQAGRHGNLAFVRDVCRRAALLADGEKVTRETLAAAVQSEVGSR